MRDEAAAAGSVVNDTASGDGRTSDDGRVAARARARVTLHLQAAEVALRVGAVASLDDAARRRRAALLDALAAYRAAGAFPRNTATATRSPVFVDDRGVRCAVGHLLHVDGRDDLVAAVVAGGNLRTVARIVVDGAPSLLSWAAARGFSVDDLARIQPSYDPFDGDPLANTIHAGDPLADVVACERGGGRKGLSWPDRLDLALGSRLDEATVRAHERRTRAAQGVGDGARPLEEEAAVAADVAALVEALVDAGAVDRLRAPVQTCVWVRATEVGGRAVLDARAAPPPPAVAFFDAVVRADDEAARAAAPTLRDAVVIDEAATWALQRGRDAAAVAVVDQAVSAEERRRLLATAGRWGREAVIAALLARGVPVDGDAIRGALGVPAGWAVGGLPALRLLVARAAPRVLWHALEEALGDRAIAGGADAILAALVPAAGADARAAIAAAVNDDVHVARCMADDRRAEALVRLARRDRAVALDALLSSDDDHGSLLQAAGEAGAVATKARIAARGAATDADSDASRDASSGRSAP